MNIFREECQADLLTDFRIIGGVNLELPSGGPEGNRVAAFFDVLRIEVVVYTDVHALIFVAQLPALGIGPGLDIRIQSLRLLDLVYSSGEVEGHDCLICLLIFHEGLIGTYPVLDGISADTKIVLNTPLSCDEAAEKYNISTGTLYCLDALSIAMESRSRINMVMLGAIARACPFIPMDSIETLCKNTIGKKYPALIGANLQGLKMGYEHASEKKIPDRTASPSLAKETYIWGYKNAPIGGINTRPGSTVSNDLSPSREGYIPLFLQDRCINCGLCDSTCPDMVFQFAPGTYKGKEAMVNQGLDYRHCKGCLRCVDVCPTHALVKAEEKDYPDKPHSMPDQDLLPDSVRYQKTGANSWITSDSYLDEKRIDGGIV